MKIYFDYSAGYNTDIPSEVEPREAGYAHYSRHGELNAAGLHWEAQWLTKVDHNNFFESILEPPVFVLFR